MNKYDLEIKGNEIVTHAETGTLTISCCVKEASHKILHVWFVHMSE